MWNVYICIYTLYIYVNINLGGLWISKQEAMVDRYVMGGG
jgi:hypothetical protein